MRAACGVALWLSISLAPMTCPAAEPSRSVLLLDQGFVGSPWYDAYASEFRHAFGPTAATGIALHVEHLDFGHFSGPPYEALSSDYLQAKYKEAQVKLIVAVGPRAFGFAVRLRAK